MKEFLVNNFATVVLVALQKIAYEVQKRWLSIDRFFSPQLVTVSLALHYVFMHMYRLIHCLCNLKLLETFNTYYRSLPNI